MADSAMAIKEEEVEFPSHKTRLDWVNDWETKTEEAQKRSRIARDYYDNHQWTKEEIAVLKKRKQPVITKNRIARKVNYFLGEEIRKRIDPVGRPRTPQSTDDARASTDALRFAKDEQGTDNVRSAVLKNMLVEGYGGAIKSMKVMANGDYKHKLTHVEWDRLGYDPTSRAPDFSDALYKFIIIWMDLADAVNEYPDSRRALEEAVNKSGHSTSSTTEDTPRGKWVDGQRKRVKIVEMYFHIGDDWFRSDFTESADLRGPERTFLLDERKEHNVCPLAMESCYVDSNGNRYGIVELFISSQDEINKRSSKALHLLSVDRTTYEKGAILDPVKYQTERAKPDGCNEVATNALFERRILNESGMELAQGQFQLLNEAKQDIESIGPSASGVNDLPGGISGRAFIARQQASSQELGTVFDQLRDWSKTIFELDWLCIRQYWTEEKWLRVTDDRELTGYRFVALNRTMTRAQRLQELLQKQPPVPLDTALATAAGEFAPEVMAGAQNAIQQQMMAMQQQAARMQQQGLQPPQIQPPDITALILQHPLMQQPVTINQAAQMLVDIVIDEAPETAVLADEQFETLGQLMPAIVQAKPEMAPKITRMLIQASSLPNKKELLKDFDEGPDPKAVQMQEQMHQMAMQLQMAQLQVEQTKAELQRAQAANQQAQAAKTGVEAQILPATTQSKLESQGIDSAVKVDDQQMKHMPQVQILAKGMPDL